jgi:DNA-directed RNA polymerase specialized sigma24 family protein
VATDRALSVLVSEAGYDDEQALDFVAAAILRHRSHPSLASLEDAIYSAAHAGWWGGPGRRIAGGLITNRFDSYIARDGYERLLSECSDVSRSALGTYFIGIKPGVRRAKFSSYAYMAMQHRLIDFTSSETRRQARFVPFVEEARPRGEDEVREGKLVHFRRDPRADDEMDEVERRRDRELIALVQPRLQLIEEVRLRFIEDWAFPEIAKRQGIKESTARERVRVWLQRARHILDEGEGGGEALRTGEKPP